MNQLNRLYSRVQQILLSGVLCGLWAVSAQAQEGPDSSGQRRSEGVHLRETDLPSDWSAVREAVTETFSQQLESSATPGGAMIVVHGGRMVVAHAHGVESSSSGTPVDVEQTRFYLASVSKSFTAAAVLKLVEEGALGLHSDVNGFLDVFHLPPFHQDGELSPPITLHHLLTHTAGLDERAIGYVARTAEEAIPTGTYLAGSLPPRVRPAGLISSYSNHGFGLAGLLVEEASGMPFRDYLQSRVLEPLEMSHSTAFYPPPPDIPGRQAVRHVLDPARGVLEGQPPDYRNIPGAGTVSASAADMSHFLMALLDEGRFRDVRLLSPAGIKLMTEAQFRHHPRLPGLAYGFYERRARGLRLVQHAGGYLGASALLVLIPELDIGYFSASNSASLSVHYQTLERLVEALTPGFKHDAADTASAGETAAAPGSLSAAAPEAAGSYSYTRYSQTTMEKIAVLDQQVRVSIDQEEQRLVFHPRHGRPSRWREIEPALLRNDETGQLLALSAGEGPPQFLFTSRSGLPVAFERNHWSLAADVQVLLLAVLSLLFLALMAGSAIWIALARGRRWKVLLKCLPAAALALLSVAYFLLLDAGLGNSFYRRSLLYGLPPEMQAFLMMGWVIAGLAAVHVLLALRVWRRRAHLAERLWQTLTMLCGLAFVAFLIHWNLL